MFSSDHKSVNSYLNPRFGMIYSQPRKQKQSDQNKNIDSYKVTKFLKLKATHKIIEWSQYTKYKYLLQFTFRSDQSVQHDLYFFTIKPRWITIRIQ